MRMYIILVNDMKYLQYQKKTLAKYLIEENKTITSGSPHSKV